MPYYRKRPVVIKATRLTEDTVIETLEGNVEGHVDDWLITGVTGERYPCGPDTFAKTYEPVGGGRFRKRQVVVEAIQLRHRTTVETGSGTLIGQPGDWFINGVNGGQYPCDREIFSETYEPIDSLETVPS